MMTARPTRRKMSNFVPEGERGKFEDVRRERAEYNDISSVSSVVFEGVPDFEIVSESSTNVNGGDESTVVEGETVSVQCSSLGHDGEMLINTIEVSTEELMSMEQLNSAEEVEFIYSPDTQFHDEEAINVNKESGEDTNNMDEGTESNGGGGGELPPFAGSNPSFTTRTIRIIRGPRLVVQSQEPSEEEDVGPPSFEKRGDTTSDLKDVQRTRIDRKNVNIHSMRSEKIKDASSRTCRKAESNCAGGESSGAPSVIFTSDLQGLEQEIPIIIKTATLAQKAVSAALEAQSILSSSETNFPSIRPTIVGGRSERCSSETFSTATVNVKVLEGTHVQLQKYFCQPGLCRVCLLSKENLTSIFEDVSIDQNGMIENARGPNAANKFHLLAALKTLLDIEVKYNDGLPSVICMECYDHLMNFSVYRKKIAIGQAKLNQILEQVKDSNAPTFIPSLGEVDITKTDIYKHAPVIILANNLLKKSQYSHFVKRSISDRLWEKIFSSLSSIVGYKSGKIKYLEHYTCEAPYVSGFFCNTCNSTIHGTKEDFAQHYYDFHGVISSGDVLYPCDICGNSYPLKDCSGESQNYAEHWLHHFFLHECNMCDKKFPSSKGLLIHKKSIHSHKQGEEKESNNLDNSFVKKAQLDGNKSSHISSGSCGENGSDTETLCRKCGKCFSSSSSLCIHSCSVHGTDRPWKCDFPNCQKRFKRKEVLISHKESVHMNLRKYECEICKVTFKSQSSKAAHLLRHKGEKRYNCPICSDQFYTSNGLKSHKVKHQDSGEYACNLCGKVFKRAATLEEHKRIHIDVKPFVCPICNRAIRMKSNYFKHMRIHKRKNEID